MQSVIASTGRYQNYFICLHSTLIRRFKGVKPRQFTSEFDCRTFMAQIAIQNINWHGLVSQLQSYSDWRNAHPFNPIQDFVIYALRRGQLQAFAMPSQCLLETTKPQRQFDVENGERKLIATASIMLNQSISDIDEFADQASAQAAIDALGITSSHLNQLTQVLSIAPNKAALAEALINGQVILYKEPQYYKPDGETSESAPLEPASNSVAENVASTAPPPPKQSSGGGEENNTDDQKDTEQTSEEDLQNRKKTSEASAESEN